VDVAIVISPRYVIRVDAQKVEESSTYETAMKEADRNASKAANGTRP
jgi:hypothetical protein